MSLARGFDAAAINAVINDPSVFPWVAMPGTTHLDLAPLLVDRRNVLLMAGGTGGFFFEQHEPGIYEIHSFFLPAMRGGAALAAFAEAMEWMFCRTDCMEVLTKVPVNNFAADGFAQRVGAVLEFERANAWPTDKGLVGVNYYAMRYPDWVRTAAGLEERGHWFHQRLEAEKERLGSLNPVHDEDPAHDRHAGACVAMIFGGQPDKAIILYNRWARFAGYALIGLNSRDPLVVDIGEALLQIEGEDFVTIGVRTPQAPSIQAA